MQNNDSVNPKATPREKRAWCRCKIKLLDSITDKVHKNADTGNYGLTEPERKVLLEIRSWIEKMPDF